MRIWLDPRKMQARNLTTEDVLAAIGEQNVQVAAGRVGEPPAPAGTSFQLVVNTLGRLRDVSQFENLIIKTGGHCDQLSRSRWGLDRFRITALENCFRTGVLTPLQQLWTAREIVAKARILAAGYRNRQKPGGACRYEALAAEWSKRCVW